MAIGKAINIATAAEKTTTVCKNHPNPAELVATRASGLSTIPGANEAIISATHFLLVRCPPFFPLERLNMVRTLLGNFPQFAALSVVPGHAKRCLTFLQVASLEPEDQKCLRPNSE